MDVRSPHQITMALAYALKESKIGEEHRVADLSKKTGLHYMTTNDYLNLIEYVQNNIPGLKKIDSKGKARVVILNEVETRFSPMEKTLLNMFDKGAFSEETAMSLSDYEFNYIERLLKEDDVVQINNRYYLTTPGIVKAAKIAGKRAERVTSLKASHESEKRIFTKPKIWMQRGSNSEEQGTCMEEPHISISNISSVKGSA